MHLVTEKIIFANTAGWVTTVNMEPTSLALLATTLAELVLLPVANVHLVTMQRKPGCLNVPRVHRDILVKVLAKPSRAGHVLLAVSLAELERLHVHRAQVATITVAWVLPLVHRAQLVTIVMKALHQ